MGALVTPGESEAVLRCLRRNAGELRSFGVRSLCLFGSVARGEDESGSDVDLLVEFAAPVGLFTFIRLQHHLEGLLGRRVDLVTLEAIRPQMRDRIQAEAIRAA